MRSWISPLTALAVLAAGAGCVGRAAAESPSARYNRMQATRQFLVSPSPYRSYSGLEPGYTSRYSLPYEYSAYWRDPGYRDVRITQRGYERYDIRSDYGEDIRNRGTVPAPEARRVPERTLSTAPLTTTVRTVRTVAPARIYRETTVVPRARIIYEGRTGPVLPFERRNVAVRDTDRGPEYPPGLSQPSPPPAKRVPPPPPLVP